MSTIPIAVVLSVDHGWGRRVSAEWPMKTAGNVGFPATGTTSGTALIVANFETTPCPTKRPVDFWTSDPLRYAHSLVRWRPQFWHQNSSPRLNRLNSLAEQRHFLSLPSFGQSRRMNRRCRRVNPVLSTEWGLSGSTPHFSLLPSTWSREEWRSVRTCRRR